MRRTRASRELAARIRANCCPIHGLTKAQFERHVYEIIRVIEKARR